MGVLTAITVVWCLLAAGVTVVALRRLRAPGPRPVGARVEDVMLLRPLDVPSPQEVENLKAPVPPGVRHVVLCPFRPSVGASVEWLPSDPLTRNRKLGHVQYALEVLRPDATTKVLVVDSDVRVDQELLERLTGALDGGAAAAWASPRPERAGVERGVLVQSLQAFDISSGLGSSVPTMCGKAVALGPAAVDVFRRLPDCVGEDLEFGARLHQRGLRLELTGHARMPGVERGSWSRFTRWMQVLRAHRPFLFPLVPIFFACTPMLIVLAAVSGDVAALGLTGVVIALRGVLAARAERVDRVQALGVWWLPGEALLLAAWVAALVLGGRVRWRGRTLEVGRGGLLLATSGRPA